MNKIKGNRVYPNAQGDLILKPGDYGKESNGEWVARPPTKVSTGSLRGHDVVENPDGTITVSPSILIEQNKGVLWHGYLRNGIWEEI